MFPLETLNRADLSKARTVLREAPDQVNGMLVGDSLDEAYKEAQLCRSRAENETRNMARLAAEVAAISASARVMRLQIIGT